MSFTRKKLGKAGEDAACRHLKRTGYSLLTRNYTSAAGEIDLICHHDGSIVFVEVKALSDDASSDPEERVTPSKQRRMERVAKAWLTENQEPDCSYRFDVVSVILPPAGPARVRHIVDAFVPSR